MAVESYDSIREVPDVPDPDAVEWHKLCADGSDPDAHGTEMAHLPHGRLALRGDDGTVVVGTPNEWLHLTQHMAKP